MRCSARLTDRASFSRIFASIGCGDGDRDGDDSPSPAGIDDSESEVYWSCDLLSIVGSGQSKMATCFANYLGVRELQHAPWRHKTSIQMALTSRCFLKPALIFSPILRQRRSTRYRRKEFYTVSVTIRMIYCDGWRNCHFYAV
jgi:hypothetical protein